MDVNVVITARSLPGKGNALAVRRPRGIYGRSTFVTDASDIGPFRVHNVNLCRPPAVRNKCNFAPGSWSPYRRYIDASRDRKTPRISYVTIGRVELRSIVTVSVGR